MKLTPLKKQTLTDQVEEQIRKAIIHGRLRPGDKLPGELEFAEQLGVSRNIVREAIGRLRMLGILESRKKRGLIITEPDVFKGLEAIVDLPVLSVEKRRQIYQLRLFFEMGIIPVVFMKKDQAFLDRLEVIVMREEDNAQDIEISIACDIAFHELLYQITGNDCLNQFQILLKPYIESNRDMFDADRFTKTELISHRDLLEALKKDSVDDYLSLMHRHLLPIFEKSV